MLHFGSLVRQPKPCHAIVLQLLKESRKEAIDSFALCRQRQSFPLLYRFWRKKEEGKLCRSAKEEALPLFLQILEVLLQATKEQIHSFIFPYLETKESRLPYGSCIRDLEKVSEGFCCKGKRRSTFSPSLERGGSLLFRAYALETIRSFPEVSLPPPVDPGERENAFTVLVLTIETRKPLKGAIDHHVLGKREGCILNLGSCTKKFGGFPKVSDACA